MKQFIKRNRFFVLLDLVGWFFIPWAVAALQYGSFTEARVLWQALLVFSLVAVTIKPLVAWNLGLYSRYWRYASIDELALISLAVATGGLGSAFVYLVVQGTIFPGHYRLGVSFLVLDSILSLLYFGGSRFANRLRSHVQRRWRGTEALHRALIVGAGDAGALVARELQANPQLDTDVVGFIDDNGSKVGTTIAGIKVLGGRAEIPGVAGELGVTEVIIAMPRVPGSEIREIREICDAASLQTKIVPGYFEIISGRVAVTQIRDVQIEDLLRRDPVETDQKEVERLVNGTTVLVTGAGGSIGSEICRQISRQGARNVILLGHGENPIFEILRELRDKFPHVDYFPVIADIRDRVRIEKTFARFKPDAVYHAAAHKHVPLMEANPDEAVMNNVGGTRTLIEASIRHGVGRFVLISTDKAVKPSSVMGSTKLIAEGLVRRAAMKSGNPYVSVRFGNVLASSGSVVPIFRSQIAAGGPVKVTHPDMTRYFMTIPEAVQLVLQAAALGEGGETFVLDMGQPVKIVQLARDLIKLSGLEVGKDIEIKFTGIRPGEKMHEELVLKSEKLLPTQHDKVYRTRNGHHIVTNAILDRLMTAAEAGDDAGVGAVLREIISGVDIGDTLEAGIELEDGAEVSADARSG